MTAKRRLTPQRSRPFGRFLLRLARFRGVGVSVIPGAKQRVWGGYGAFVRACANTLKVRLVCPARTRF